MVDRTLTPGTKAIPASNGNNAEIQRLFNRAVHELGELFAGKQTVRVAGGPVTGYRFNVSEHRFAAANTALHDLGVAINRSSHETPATQDPLGYAYEIDGVMMDVIYHEQRDAEIFAKVHRAAGRQAEVIALYERPSNETLSVDPRDTLIAALTKWAADWSVVRQHEVDLDKGWRFAAEEVKSIIEKSANTQKASEPSPNDALCWICPRCTTVNGIEDEVCVCRGRRPSQGKPE